MKSIFLFAFFTFFALTFSSALQAVEASDNIIRNAQADIERYESQASGLTPARSSGANRILKLMALSQQRLDSSPNKGDASWTAVNDRYVALSAKLEALLNPPKSGDSSTVNTTAQTQSTSAPAAAGQTPSEAASSAPAPQPSTPPLVSGQRVQVKKLTRDMNGVRNAIVGSGPSHFQDPDEVSARQKSLQQYRDAVARYPQVDDPDVQAARAEYDALQAALAAEFERAQAQMAQLGDVQQALVTIESNSSTYAVPAPLAIPFTPEEVTAWIEAAGNARTVAEHNLQQLEIMASLAYLPNNPGTPQTGSPYDLNDVLRLQRNSAEMLNAVQANYQAMAQTLALQMEQIERDTLSRWQENPENDEKRWLFIGEGQLEEANRVYADALAIANSSVYLETALGRESAEAEAVVAKIQQAQSEFAHKRELALKSSRLPESKSENKDMLKIAEQILAKPRYEFGQHGPIVLTSSEIVEREREDSEIDIDDAELTLSGDLKMSGTETTWSYKWQEFKFAAPLKEKGSDTWYIWWITAKNFSSGGARTPLNQWVSGEATKGNPILPENM